MGKRKEIVKNTTHGLVCPYAWFRSPLSFVGISNTPLCAQLACPTPPPSRRRYLLLTCQKFFRRQLARVGTQDSAERPGFVFAKAMGRTQYRTRSHIMTSRNPVAAQFIVPRLCARLRHQAVEVSFVDLPKVFQATACAGQYARSDRASRICFCQEHDHGDHGGGHNTAHVATS